MAYWRLRQTFTDPEVLGFTFSSTNTAITGDYLKTSQTFHNYPVWYNSAKGMYLFVAENPNWGENYYALNTSLTDFGEMDEEWNYTENTYYGQHGTPEMMYTEDDPEMESFDSPTPTFLSSNWTRNDGQTGSYAITASYLYAATSPLLDAAGADAYGRVARVSTALDIPCEGLAFDAQFTHQISRAATGQALTIDTELKDGDVTIWKTVGGLQCLQSYYGRDGGVGGVSFPDDALNGGRKALTVSAWVYVIVNSVYEASHWFYIGDSSSGYLSFGIEGDTYYSGKPSLSVHGQYPGGQIEANKWYHVVLAFTGRSVIAHLNGKFTGTCACDVNVKKSGTAYVCRHPTGAGALGGCIAGIRIYNRILSETEVQRLFNEHKEVVQ